MGGGEEHESNFFILLKALSLFVFRIAELSADQVSFIFTYQEELSKTIKELKSMGNDK